ncbi:hypothetical protein CQW23_04389 [Capsicum baccatum]|uniref:Glutaredoxin domain-containing protein n=1 Tax=Capsicum baccatum TaxID=33114 RepID=A0A2G2XEH3_CAPBA|nr:hypothetical protein CQW23_04389 [Capsicum baccatum]
MHRTSAGRFSITPTTGGSDSGESRTPPGLPSNRRKGKAITGFDKLIAENAILIVSMSECCMCASVKSLLVSLGVNPMIFKVDEEEKTSVLIKLIKMNEGVSNDTGERWELPAVYIRGKDLEGVDKSTVHDPKVSVKSHLVESYLWFMIWHHPYESKVPQFFPYSDVFRYVSLSRYLREVH